jgi:hypothetical protein
MYSKEGAADVECPLKSHRRVLKLSSFTPISAFIPSSLYDEALRTTRTERPFRDICRLFLLKGLQPLTVLVSKIYTWYFLLAVYIGFEFISIRTRKSVI